MIGNSVPGPKVCSGIQHIEWLSNRCALAVGKRRSVHGQYFLIEKCPFCHQTEKRVSDSRGFVGLMNGLFQ